MAHELELIRATSRFEARRKASGRLEAPERRMSSPVMTWIADAVSDNFSGRLETEVTSTSMSCSRLNFFSAVGDDSASGVWATPWPAQTSRPSAAKAGAAGQMAQARLRLAVRRLVVMT